MARTSFLIIVNPTSGRRKALRLAEEVAAHLGRRDRSVVIRHTEAPHDAERIAREACTAGADRPDCIVACGGDGTVQDVANALAPVQASQPAQSPVMGLAPAGRCNDFARALGVTADPITVASALADAEPRAIDLGRLNGRYFCTVATLGVDAEVTSYVDTMRMPLRGTAAYVYGALRVLSRYRASGVRITGDFGVIEKQVFLASSANTSSYGGAIPIAPDASPTDGELDLCVIDRVTRLRAFSLLPIVMMGRHKTRVGVRFIRTKRFTISATPPPAGSRLKNRRRTNHGPADSPPALEFWADGERIGQTPADVEVVPGAIRILLPSESEPRQ